MTKAQLIELGVIVAGWTIIVGWLVATAIRRQWATSISLPKGPPHRISGFDIAVAGWAFLVFRLMAIQIALAFDGGAAASQPTTGGSAESLAGELGMAAGSIASIGMFVAIAAARFDEGLKAWHLKEMLRPRWIGMALILTIVSVSICSPLLIASDHFLRTVFEFESPVHEKILLLQRDDVPKPVVAFAILGAVLFAPLVEELFFRGLLVPALVKWLGRPIWAILVSSLVFGLIHYSVAPATVFPLMVFGGILAAAYLRSGTVVLPILIHVFFNAKTVVWLLLGFDHG